MSNGPATMPPIGIGSRGNKRILSARCSRQETSLCSEALEQSLPDVGKVWSVIAEMLPAAPLNRGIRGRRLSRGVAA